MISIYQVNQYRYDVYWTNNFKSLGTFEQDVDGYFYWFMPDLPTTGFISHEQIRLLAEKLEEINEPWDKIVEQELGKLDETINQNSSI